MCVKNQEAGLQSYIQPAGPDGIRGREDFYLNIEVLLLWQTIGVLSSRSNLSGPSHEWSLALLQSLA